MADASGWNKPLKVDFHLREFMAALAQEMEQQTPVQTGTLRNSNRVFDMGNYTLKVANKIEYALPQHEGAEYKVGVTWWQRHHGVLVQHTRRKPWSLKGHFWVPRSLNATTSKFKVSWDERA